jgi:hypothetical protein
VLIEYLDAMREIESGAIRQLYDYWRGKCRDGRLPRRADIDPADLVPLLPNLLIADIEEPFRVRYRLVGTKIVEMTGFEMTGKYLDEIAASADEPTIAECYRRAAAEKRPVCARMRWHLAEDNVAEYDCSVLPLSNDGLRVDMVLGLECYDRLEHHYALWRRSAPNGR